MRHMTKLLMITVLVVYLLLSGCIQPSANTMEPPTSAEDNQVQKLVIGTTNKVEDTNINDYCFGIFLRQMSHQALVTISADGDIVPELATSWNTSDLKTWTFHLVDNATWHDGKPLTAQDIKFTMDYRKKNDPNWKSVFGDLLSVEAPDNRTVIMTLDKPDFNFLMNLAVYRILPEHVYKKVEDPKKFNTPDAWIGTGPYVLKSFDKATGLLHFEAYDQYWGSAPAIDQIDIRYFANTDTMILAFQKGEIDVPYAYATGFSPFYMPKLLNDEDIGIMIQKNGGITNVLWFNENKTYFDSKVFRQAVSYAIDYEEMKNIFTAGYGSIPDAGLVPQGTLYYKETRTLAYDVNKSRDLLDAAGFKDTDGDGFREALGGKKFQPVLSTRSDMADNVRAVEMLKKYLNAVGIDVQLKVMDRTSFSNSLDFDKTHEMALTRTTYWGMQMCAGYGSGYIDQRFYGWSMVNDSKFQTIVDQLTSTIDKDKRKALAGQIQDYYADEMPAIAVYNMDIIQPYNKNYAGWVYNPYNGVLNYDTLFSLHKV
ncbi:ABC transporter substrate-binding protein [Methanosarcina acetivorans]|nr:ABC transporter substrate-binding protein [Methanosarcina acetivorans]